MKGYIINQNGSRWELKHSLRSHVYQVFVAFCILAISLGLTFGFGLTLLEGVQKGTIVYITVFGVGLLIAILGLFAFYRRAVEVFRTIGRGFSVDLFPGLVNAYGVEEELTGASAVRRIRTPSPEWDSERLVIQAAGREVILLKSHDCSHEGEWDEIGKSLSLFLGLPYEIIDEDLFDHSQRLRRLG